jgi:flagellin
MISVQSNVSSLTAQHNLGKTVNTMEKSLSRLSSGYRITSASDDAAGLGISENLRAQIASTSQASRNANDGVSVVQTAEGSMGEISDMLVRMRELAVASSSDGITDTERAYVDEEFQGLSKEIDRIANVTEFNGTKLLDGSIEATGSGLEFQIGMRNTTNDRLEINAADMQTSALGLNTSKADTKANARTAIDALDTAIKSVSTSRAKLGALSNRLDTTIGNLGTQLESLSAANSRIRDVDVASEMASFSRQQVLMQAGTSMLSQANSLPQNALSLLR